MPCARSTATSDIGAGIVVERGQPIDVGTEDFGLPGGDDLELGPSQLGVAYLLIRVIIRSISEPENVVNLLVIPVP
jgi:hypothetical protein